MQKSIPQFYAGSSRVNLPIGDFFGLLDSSQMRQATRDCLSALRAVIAISDRATDDELAKQAHALITFAVVLGFDDLAHACRRFEATVADRTDSSLARKALLDSVDRAFRKVLMTADQSGEEGSTGERAP